MKKIENLIGFAIIAVILLFGKTFITNSMSYFRLLIGIGFGYALMRSFFGFAGSVNRAYNTGSTKLMRALMFLVVISSIMTAALLHNTPECVTYSLWVNPINMGLLLGAFTFGIGMSFSSCCASGTLTDIGAGAPRAVITLIFFGLGVLMGTPVVKELSWVKESWFATTSFPKGVYLPDLFKTETSTGLLGAITLTVFIAFVVIYLSYQYEKKRKLSHTYTGVDSEKLQYSEVKPIDMEHTSFFSSEIYNAIFVRPWGLLVGAAVISVLYLILMIVTKSGWGASGPYGFWVGRMITMFGVSPEALATFIKGKPDPFTMPFFENPMYAQNLGLIIGSMLALLLSGTFVSTFKSELKISVKDVIIFAIGGFLMGFGTRFSNGCNVGAMFTPIANFSLSGWIFLLMMVTGGIVGNTINKKIRS